MCTNELKVNKFLEGLRVEIYRDIKMSTTRGIPYLELAEKALEVEEAELGVIKAQKVQRNITFVIGT